MNQAALNRHSEALNALQGASNLSGIARSLVRAINQCHTENPGSQEIRDDPAIRFFVHHMAFLCNVGELDRKPDVYEALEKACEVGSATRKAELRTRQQA
ncbi:hypothetical protein HDG34_003201 [Paraburkholderia sp. HC6.4b]|uniref:hypothetical protein n=1 Tax=unclassified Paraburkholderia TaxID=2615204 RepID=UPI0016128EAF|nr:MULTISPECIES: hypothetical protein [unclassified Paraburkholderia]MBB5409260.1 hypothetical protein [Paraburkholderia sp. HC6.4b]MBB5450988.1 hypothetical protein [Paraburkholderia sp. Kb1A]